jgi:hypothetical protein
MHEGSKSILKIDSIDEKTDKPVEQEAESEPEKE